MHDSENQDHPVIVDDVVHHAVVAYAKSVKRVAYPLDGLDRLAADATLLGGLTRQPLKRALHPLPDLDWQLLESSDRRRRQLDGVGDQARSFRLVVRPSA